MKEKAQKKAVCNHGLLLLEVGEDFSLEKAVCNHGFFMMAPNRWIPSERSLIRPLQINNNVTTVSVSITQHENLLLLTVFHSKQHQLSDLDEHAIRSQVSRMLRISDRDDAMVKEFHSVYPDAKAIGFARVFRSPTLFEDMIKSLLLCNCRWSRSLEMARALCDLDHKLSSQKRKRSSLCNNSVACCWRAANFPSPEQLGCLDKDTLNRHCNLGYRASIIVELAQSILNGRLDLGHLQNLDYQILRRSLMAQKGFGRFVVANIVMCVGFYQDIPVDSETIKHIKEVHGKTVSMKFHAEVISETYDKYAPFQCLVYWMERVKYYEKNLGKLSELPHSAYCKVSTTNIG